MQSGQQKPLPVELVGPGITRTALDKGRFPAYGFTVDTLPKAAAYLILQQAPLKDTWIVAKLYVAPDYRRQGYGKRLLRFVCEYADGNGYTLRLSVQPQADRPMSLGELRAFYQKFGFTGDIGMIRECQNHSQFAPGSDSAVAFGCICPTKANRYGGGVYRTQNEIGYQLAEDCVLHGKFKRQSDAAMAESKEGVGG